MFLGTEKLPIVLAIVENFGLSSSWTGNAIASADPENFYSLWNEYPHTVLYPNKALNAHSYENEGIDMTRLFSGREVMSDKDYLNYIIENNQLEDNKLFSEIIKDTIDKNSAFHLIGNLPGKINKYSEMQQLISILEILSKNKIVRVYLHLIVNDELKEDQTFFADFFSKIKMFNSCEIASVVGQNYIADTVFDKKKFLKAVNTIINGEGERALSAEQALSFQNLSDISDKKPTSIIFKNRFVCRINNFDTVLFFNHNNKSFSKFILAMTTNIGLSGLPNAPKLLNLAMLFPSLDNDLDQLKIVFKRLSTQTLAQFLYSAKINQLYLSDTTRIANIKKYLIGDINGDGGQIKELYVPVVKNSDPTHYDQALSIILNQVSSHLKDKSADFITILIPALSSQNISFFTQRCKTVKIIDQYLLKLEKEVAKRQACLVLTSDHAGSEKMSERSDYEKINNKTNNPVPFILKIPGQKEIVQEKSKIYGNRIFYDMINKKHFINDFAPTMLDLAGVEKPSIMTGKSFLSELKRIEIDSSPFDPSPL